MIGESILQTVCCIAVTIAADCHHDSHREPTVIKNGTPKKNRLKGGFVFSSISLIHEEKIGAGERSRTLDLLITNELLYQLSYTGVSAMSH